MDLSDNQELVSNSLSRPVVVVITWVAHIKDIL